MTIYYEEPGIRIYHGKAEDVLPTLGRFDLLLTDPPYGINADRDRNCPANGWRDYGTTGWDKTPISPETIALCRLSAAKQVIWGGELLRTSAVAGVAGMGQDAAGLLLGRWGTCLD